MTTANSHLKQFLAGICLGAIAAGAPAHANGEAFDNAGHGQVDYRQLVAEPARRCKDLISTSNYAFTVISAVEFGADSGVPAHCRVTGVVPSEVRFEINLPREWNGRLYMYGNGGLAGTPAIDADKQRSRDQALRHHFATAYTDTGHDRRVEPGGTFARNTFHKLVDYGFRAVHLTVVSARELATAYYRTPVKTAYWNGCSTGGRQAMINAQRFPADFDGIVAGAPAADYSGLKFSQAWRVAAIAASGLTEAEVLVLADHIYARCDALDGLRDGLLSDPRTCDFDPARDLPQCPGADQVDCFDPTERAALARYYAPVMLAGEQIYPAMPVGSEVLGTDYAGEAHSGWVPWLINEQGPVLLDLLGSDFFRYMAFVVDRPEFEWTEFDFASRPDNLDEFRAIVDALDPDLSAFRDRGGKLLSYFGWADPDINPLTLLDYRGQVAQLDPALDDYFRVFMMPGMFHCRGGAGPDRFDPMTPLIDWVEAGRAPDQFDTWKENTPGVRSDFRPSCAYPARAVARDDGFVCK